MSSDELQEIRMVFQGLRTLYQTYLPKVDPILIHDLLVREQEKGKKSTSASSSSSSSPPFYIVEISTRKGTDPEKMKNMIFGKTGLLPTIRENGTRYIANMRLTLELLRAISDFEEGIVRITGDYTGGITGR
jgi:hypothetical protein